MSQVYWITNDLTDPTGTRYNYGVAASPRDLDPARPLSNLFVYKADWTAKLVALGIAVDSNGDPTIPSP